VHTACTTLVTQARYRCVCAGVIMVVATLIAVVFADRWGRHALFLSGAALAPVIAPQLWMNTCSQL